MGIINLINDLLWTYILVALLLGCAVWFTLRTRFVQFRMIKEMVRLLGDSGGKGDAKEKHISSFQAFAISIASPCRYGQSCRGCHRHCSRRSGRCILDVGDCPPGCFQLVCRIYTGPIV